MVDVELLGDVPLLELGLSPSLANGFWSGLSSDLEMLILSLGDSEGEGCGGLFFWADSPSFDGAACALSFAMRLLRIYFV